MHIFIYLFEIVIEIDCLAYEMRNTYGRTDNGDEVVEVICLGGGRIGINKANLTIDIYSYS